ncbi:MAG: ATP-dependent helicase [bacterium]
MSNESPKATSLPLSQRAMARPAPSADAPYLRGLNDAQREAVLTLEGPVLMLAGAGTGKTRALTTRLAHLIQTRMAAPWQILAVTFTNKAAREMKDRIAELIGERVEGMGWLGTFHAIAAKILRRHAEIVGLKSSFTIIDTDDQIRLCKQVIEASGLDEKRWTGRGLAAFIDDWKNRGLVPSAVPKNENFFFGDGKHKGRGAIDLYQAYQSRLQTLNAADFGDLLVHNLTIFTSQADILANYQTRFKFMLVDEYQDTNIAQYMWLRLLARQHHNICVVGDDDQSIYGWRGAEVANILNFEKDFPGAKIIRLEQNYRSTPAILAAASGLIDANKNRLGKTLWTQIDNDEKVQLRGVWDGDEEARSITDDIEREHSRGHSLSDMAVLVRASFQMRAFEERFNTAGIAYQVVGGPRFYEREETRDALAYLRLVRNQDDDLSFTRIVNKPRRGFGDKAVQTLTIAAREMQCSMAQAGRSLLETAEIKGKAKTGLAQLLEALDRWRDNAKTFDPATLTETVLEESGYTDYWKNSKNVQAPSKLENLKELVNAAGEFETLEGYLDHVSLVSDVNQATEGGHVWLMTLHAAKGLEFPIVFLPGWEEEIFPSARSLDENGTEGLEEERRLAYVGITRAMSSARISFVANRQIYGRWQNALPSRFIDELPEEHVEVRSEPGLYGTKASDLPAFSQFEGLKQEEDSYYDNPGWQRARHAQKKTGTRNTVPTLDGKAKLIATTTPGSSTYKVGERVFHQKFGYGAILAIEGNKLKINFEKGSTKKVIDSFVARP